MSSWFPSHSPSSYIPSETEPSLATSTAGSNHEHRAFESAIYDYAGHDHAYHNPSWTFSVPARRYDPHVQWNPIDLPPSPSQSVNARDGKSYKPFPRFIGYGAIYTDDARMKLGDGIRRQCFNCRARETTTWRRSVLSSGKLVRLTWSSGYLFLTQLQLCNRCGLFERTHGIPRPKAFPRRRRSRPAPVDKSVDLAPFNSDGHSSFTGWSPYKPSAPQSPDALDTVGGETTSQDTPWMTHGMPHVSPTSSHPSPSQSTAAEQPIAYHPEFQSLSIVPTTATYTASPAWEFFSTYPN
jgi:hypothetical protein